MKIGSKNLRWIKGFLVKTMSDEITRKQLRSFGLIVGGVFGVIGVWPLVFRHQDPRWWCLGLAVCLVVSAVVFPSSLCRVYKGWMWIGNIMGWVNTRIILGFAFFGLITPIGLYRSWLLRKDPLGRHLKPQADSYRINCKPRPSSHLTKQY
jgi:hypothetical protein